MVKEWADMVLFANYKTMVVNVDGQGVQKGKNKAQGGKRVMYTTHHSCWDAKNRYSLPDEVPFTYESIRQILEPGAARAEERQEVKQPGPVQETHPAPPVRPAETVKHPETASSNKGNEKPAEEKKGIAPVEGSKGDVKPDGRSALDPRLPKRLRDLMIANDVCECLK